MAANHGLITRAQALDAGLSPSAIRWLLKTGELVRAHRGVYADGELWRSLDDHRGRPRMRAHAAVLTLRRSYVLSHDSAGHEQELDLLQVPDPHVHITRPGFTAAWTEYGVKHHLARFRPEQVVVPDGFAALDLARTAVDIAREHGAPYGEVACDSAMRKGVTRAELEEAIAPMVCWPHIRRTRAAVDFARPGTGSVAETLGRLLVCELGLDAPIEIQFPVRREQGRVAWLDILVGRHAFEVDGKGKYVPIELGGFSAHLPQEVLWAEKRRERELHRVGLGTSRIFWEDFWGAQRRMALQRMREEYAETAYRFGTVLPERLVREARELRGDLGA